VISRLCSFSASRHSAYEHQYMTINEELISTVPARNLVSRQDLSATKKGKVHNKTKILVLHKQD